MAFSSSSDTDRGMVVMGNRRLVTGTFTQGDADSGGTITTGLTKVDMFVPTPTSHVGLAMPKYSVSGGTVTLVTPNGMDGTWVALGS